MPLRLRLPAAPGSGAEARHAVSGWLAAQGLATRSDDVALLTSELVTNAVRHGAGPLDLVLSVAEGRLRVAVTDRGRRTPQPREASPDDTGGRGLAIVAALALRWGVDPLPGADGGDPAAGKVVWAEVALDEAVTRGRA